jgi:hypothetical protein
MSSYGPYTCTMLENPGDAEIFDASGTKINTLRASRCHLEWWCPPNDCTWSWRGGIDPDDPATWPPHPEPTPEPAPNE